MRLLGWAGYDHGLRQAFERFTAVSGIAVEFIGCRNQDEMLNAAKAAAKHGVGCDVASPTTDRILSWMQEGLLHPWDETAISFGGIDPRYHADKQTLVAGKRMGSPNLWGSAGIGHHVLDVPLNQASARLIDLFNDAHVGHLAMREDTSFVAAGRALESTSQLPHPFDESYVDEEKMIANYDVILRFLVEKKPNVGSFWFSEEEGQRAYRSEGCRIGYSWDTSMAALRREGLPFGFVAPVEGAACYLQNFVLLAGAANVAAASEWVAWVNSPEGGALYAAAFAAYSPSTGAVELMGPDEQEFFDYAYPSDALDRLWWQPSQPPWFAERRAAYARLYRG